MRKLTDILAEQAAAAADERDLTSRSDLRKQRKRVESEGAELAQILVESTPRQLAKLGLPEEVQEAVLVARAIQSPGARARSLKLVRRELRSADSAAIQAKLASPHGLISGTAVGVPVVTAESPLEMWKMRLADGGEEALSTFVDSFPQADRQQLRALVRNLRKAKADGQRKASEALIRVLRPILRAPGK